MTNLASRVFHCRMDEELEAIELEDDDPLEHVGEEAAPPEDLGRGPEEDEEEADE